MLSSTTRENASNLKKDIKLTAASAAQDISDATGGNVIHAASEYAHEAGRKARDYYETANHNFSEAADKLQEEIRANPLRSGAMALGMGVILGLLLRR